MKIYHGTHEAAAKKADKCGLLPPSQLSREERTDWGDCPSHPDCIYLTDTYAGLFAGKAAGDEGGRWAIIEIDTDRINEDRLLPDEDFLEQATREMPISKDTYAPPPDLDMTARTKWFRDRLPDFWHMTQLSLDKLGNVAYYCDPESDDDCQIYASAITRITLFDPKSNANIALMALDAQVSLMNHAIASRKYKELTRWLAGYEDVKAESLCGFDFIPTAELDEQLREILGPHMEIVEQMAELLKNRDGIEIIA